MKWYIVKYDKGFISDGYYGWDTVLHCSEQIYREDHLPSKIIYVEKVMVGRGHRPTVKEALEMLE